MPGITRHYTNKQWARLGRDLRVFHDAWIDHRFGGTGVHCAELVECFDDVKYVLNLPRADVIACADFYDMDWSPLERFTWIDWRVLINDWRGEDVEE